MSVASYQQFFAFFGLQENPFSVSPDSRFYFSTPAHDHALAELLFAIQTHHGLMLLTGEAGTGKTTLVHRLLDALRQRRISSSYVFHSRLEPVDLFDFILRDFGVTCASRGKGEMLQTLHQWVLQRTAQGDSPVVIIDEAQALSGATLDELRLLLNLESPTGKLVQIVLAGQPELDEKLRHQELRQLRQRVMFHCRLPLLNAEDTHAYIYSRMSRVGSPSPDLFPETATAEIHRYSQGVPRTVNLLCEHALLNAYAMERKTVSDEDIRVVAADFDLLDHPLSLKIGEALPERVLRFPIAELAPIVVERKPEQIPMVAPLARAAAARGGGVGSIAMISMDQTVSRPMPSARPPVPPSPMPAVPTPSAALRVGADPKPVPPMPKPQPVAAPAPEHQPVRWQKHETQSGFVRYWKEVAESFQRDIRAFRDATSVRPKTADNDNRGVDPKRPGTSNTF